MLPDISLYDGAGRDQMAGGVNVKLDIDRIEWWCYRENELRSLEHRSSVLLRPLCDGAALIVEMDVPVGCLYVEPSMRRCVAS